MSHPSQHSIRNVQRKFQPRRAAASLRTGRHNSVQLNEQALLRLKQLLILVNSGQPDTAILAYSCNVLVDLTGAAAAAVYQFESESGLSVLKGHTGLPPAIAHQTNLDLTAIPVSQATVYQPLVWPRLDDIAVDLISSERIKLFREVFTGMIGIPLMVRDEFYGCLILLATDERCFRPARIQIACTISEYITLGLENTLSRVQAEQAAISSERARLARDLHDSVTQTLFSASLIAEVLPRLWEKDREEGVRQLFELQALTRSALAEMRGLLFELRPAALFKAPLPEILRHLVEGAAGRASIPIALTTGGKNPLPIEIKIAFYRIAQEALNNVVKHANATRASVQLERQPSHSLLIVTDNGRGFQPGNTSPGRLGLTIMSERAHGIGAQLTVQSTPGKGTQITVQWNAPKPEDG